MQAIMHVCISLCRVIIDADQVNSTMISDLPVSTRFEVVEHLQLETGEQNIRYRENKFEYVNICVPYHRQCILVATSAVKIVLYILVSTVLRTWFFLICDRAIRVGLFAGAIQNSNLGLVEDISVTYSLNHPSKNGPQKLSLSVQQTASRESRSL